MEERIATFLKDALALKGEDLNVIRDGARRRLTLDEKQLREHETDKRMEDMAVHAFHSLCRARVAEEIKRGKGTSTAEHFKIVLGVIDGLGQFQLKDR
jgi:hypothetical protein